MYIYVAEKRYVIPVMIDEVLHAIKCMNKCNCLGEDGIAIGPNKESGEKIVEMYMVSQVSREISYTRK